MGDAGADPITKQPGCKRAHMPMLVVGAAQPVWLRCDPTPALLPTQIHPNRVETPIRPCPPSRPRSPAHNRRERANPGRSAGGGGPVAPPLPHGVVRIRLFATPGLYAPGKRRLESGGTGWCQPSRDGASRPKHGTIRLHS